MTLDGDFPTHPKTQEEANKLYRELALDMCDEVIFRDGEATWAEARASFNYGLSKATKIFKRHRVPASKRRCFFGWRTSVAHERPIRKLSRRTMMSPLPRTKYRGSDFGDLIAEHPTAECNNVNEKLSMNCSLPQVR